MGIAIKVEPVKLYYTKAPTQCPHYSELYDTSHNSVWSCHILSRETKNMNSQLVQTMIALLFWSFWTELVPSC